MNFITHIENFIRDHAPQSVVIVLIALKKYYVGEPELRLLSKLVSNEKNSIDIGANNGVYTYHLSRLSKQVYSYEPNPRLAKKLQESQLDNVEVRNIALSDIKGVATLRLPVIDGISNTGRASLEANAFDNSITQLETFKVDTRLLNDERLHNIGFIKIDVEGHELSVLKGGEQLIRQEKPVLLVEIEQRHISFDIQDVFDFVCQMGYVGFFLNTGQIQKLSTFNRDVHQQNYTDGMSKPDTYINNFIFIPEQRSIFD